MHDIAAAAPVPPRMTVEIWADIICPWCGLGEHRFEAAMQQFAHRDDVEVVHRSFQLDPTLPIGVSTSVREHLGRRFGLGSGPDGSNRIETMTRRVEVLAAREGLQPYNVLDNATGNTALAHEMLAYASTQGRNADAWHRVSRAYFGEQKSIFDIDSLVQLASDMGLDPVHVREALETRQYRGEVERDGLEAKELGATGVPFFVIDRRYGVMGAQESDVLLGALRQAWHESHPRLQRIDGADTHVTCGPDGCLPATP
jgi:predicted DsbA family dithiol-disulfide isomerase